MKMEFEVDDDVADMVPGIAIAIFTTFNRDGERFIGISTQGTADAPEWIGIIEMAKQKVLQRAT